MIKRDFMLYWDGSAERRLSQLTDELSGKIYQENSRVFLVHSQGVQELDIINIEAIEGCDNSPTRIKMDAHIRPRSLDIPRLSDGFLQSPLLPCDRRLPGIKDVIFNPPATIVLWADGSKTVVKCGEGDTYSKELGLAMCIAKKALGNKGNYNKVFKKWLKEKNE